MRMTLLKSITTALRQLQAEQEIHNLAIVLQRRLDDLTCRELREVLVSPLGRRADKVKVRDLLGLPPAPSMGDQDPLPGSAESSPPAKSSKRTRVTKATSAKTKKASSRKPRSPKAKAKKKAKKKAKAKSTQGAKKATTPASRRARPSSSVTATASMMLDALRDRSSPTSSAELTSAVKTSRSTGRRALDVLLDTGAIRQIGSSRQHAFVISDGPTSVESKATGAASSTYGEEIVATLREAAGWTMAGPIRQRVGGTPQKLSRALARLLREGRIERSGERHLTQYRLGHGAAE